MNTTVRPLVYCLATLLVMSCSTTQSRYSMLAKSYPSKSDNYDIQIFRNEEPKRAFERIARLDVHLEKTHFISSSLDEAIPELKKQARLSGAEAIIEIRESSTTVGETKIYHVTATGIRYTDEQ